MLYPGGYFAVIQLPAMEGSVHVGAEVRPEDGEGFAIKSPVTNRFQKEIHLKFGIEPALLQVGPGAPRELGRAGKLGVVLGKTHGRPIEHRMVKPRFDTLERLLEIRFALQIHQTPLSCGSQNTGLTSRKPSENQTRESRGDSTSNSPYARQLMRGSGTPRRGSARETDGWGRRFFTPASASRPPITSAQASIAVGMASQLK